MGKPPAVIFVVRHASRLDAADPQWHLTSPTPYDPPLTYGGWKQAQALGARIGSIIRFREDGKEATSSYGADPQQHHAKRRRRHKVVVHSSPYLRCIQTSIAINAGMDHWIGKLNSEQRNSTPRHQHLHSGSPHVHALDAAMSPHLSAIPEPDVLSSKKLSDSKTIEASSGERFKTLLRLDAFLGEWLSPDYFEDITPPPNSKMMMVAAIAQTLRRRELVEAKSPGKDSKINKGNFPGGWASEHPIVDHPPKVLGRESKDKSEVDQLPKLARSKTHSSTTSGRKFSGHLSIFHDSASPLQSTGYTAPIPPYAISPNQPIPQGYVTHACDACTHVDYQWDSMKPPLEWGSGGDFGEEWSDMHRRFRKGLHEMISWYREHYVAEEPEIDEDEPEVLHHASTQPSAASEDDEADTVLILVTHGAGCNALIGALTNQPVLIDVGLASLTMAVRRDPSENRFSPFNHNAIRRRRASYDQGTADDYEVKLTASVDHLRPGSQFLGPQPTRARSPSLPIREKSPYRYERHVGSPTRRNFSQSPVRKTSPPTSKRVPSEPEPKRTPGGSFEEVDSRGSSQRASTASTTANGLWSKPPQPPSNSLSQSLKSRFDPPTKPPSSRPHHETESLANGNPPSSNGTGLWSASSRKADQLRDQSTPKRRWTSGPAK